MRPLLLLLLLAGCTPDKSGDSAPPSGTTPAGTTPSTGAAIEVDPPSLAFVPGCPDAQEVGLTPLGPAPVELMLAQLDGDPELSFAGAPLPLTLAPGDRWSAIVSYAPGPTEAPAGTLSVATDTAGLVEIPIDTSADLGPLSDSFVAQGGAVDVLFLVDKSGSMTDELGAIPAAATDLLDALDTQGIDWQVGIVTRTTGCAEALLTPTTPNAHDVFDDTMTALQFADTSEALLQAAEAALLASGPGGCAEGISRADVPLHVVLVSDEPDQSYAPIPDQVAALESWLGPARPLTISGVLDLNSSCGAGATGYVDAIASTGGTQRDLCTADWAAHFAALATAAPLQSQSSFAPSALPDPATLTVQLDGVATGAWSWDAAARVVRLDSPVPDGTVVDLAYTGIACLD